MRQAAVFPLNLLVKEAFGAVRPFSRVDEADLREKLTDRGGRLLPLSPESVRELTARPVGGRPDQVDIVVPLVTADGPTGGGLLVRVTEHGSYYRPEVLSFVDVEPSETQSLPGAVRGAAVVGSPGSPGTPEEGLRAVPERWRPVVAGVVRRLAAGDFTGLVRDGVAPAREGPDDLGFEHWVVKYPASLVDLPDEAWTFTDHRPTGEQDVWDVSVDLWTAEEGRSDLTLEGQVRDDGSAVILRIERIHTL